MNPIRGFGITAVIVCAMGAGYHMALDNMGFFIFQIILTIMNVPFAIGAFE